jgi:hypothetical protein
VDTDVSRNVVVFQLRRRDAQPVIADGSTRDDDCVRQAWSRVQREYRVSAKEVRALHSEWEPSPADATFIRKTFPKATFTYNFSRPAPDGWDAAFATARQIIAEAGLKEAPPGSSRSEGRGSRTDRLKEAPPGSSRSEGRGSTTDRLKEAEQNMQHVAEHGELLPVLWSHASPKREVLDFLPRQSVVPGRLSVALATVAPTPRGSIGMNHLTHAGLEGRSFGDLMAAAAENLAGRLSVDGHADPQRPERGQLLVVRRDGPFGASALVLPGFHGRMSGLVGHDQLLVGVPDPDTLLVTGVNSGWVDEVERAVLNSPCPPAELLPTMLSLTPAGAQVLSERR